MQIITEAALVATLLIAAISDLKDRTISLPMLAASGAIGAGLAIAGGGMALDVIAGMGVGLLLLALGFAFGGSIGAGDGALFLVTGVFLGGEGNLELLMTSLLLAGAAGLLFLMLGKKRRDEEMPFAPFVLAAHLIGIVCGAFAQGGIFA